MQLNYVADDASVLALARLGRTEDIQFSPNNRWLAVVGANEDRVLILSVDTSAILSGGPVQLGHSLELTCADFNFPHGLCWLDDGTIAVANRNGLAVVLHVSRLLGKTRQARVAPSLIIGAEPIDRIVTPGSVTSNRLDDDLFEILICNNYAHYVTRHLVELGASPRILGSQVLVQKDLDIPDGLTSCPRRQWLAVSNHTRHCVHLYRTSQNLGPLQPPDGRLLGSLYPHGLRFSQNQRLIVLADAGAPFVHIYHSPSGQWDGDREPVYSLRVVDEEAFKRGNSNPQEGGPKGVDICRKNQVLVATCEFEPMSFSRIDQIIAEIDDDSNCALPPDDRKDQSGTREAIFIRELEAARQDGNRLQLAIAEARSALATQQEAHHALSQSHHELAQWHHELSQQHHKLMVQPWRSVIFPELMRFLRSILPVARFFGGAKKS